MAPSDRSALTIFGWMSVAAALVTIGLKLLAWWLTDSVGLLSDAMESFVNLAAAVGMMVALQVASRPADAEHPFGHGKAEYFASGFEGAMIFIAALAIGWTAIDRLLHPRPLDQPGLGLALSTAASLVNLATAVVLIRAGKKHHSIALEADGKHLMTDVWTSAGVLVAVGLVWATGWQILDPLIALAVAANIVREGVSLVRRSADGLMDRALEPAVQADIERTLEGFRHHAVRFDHVITRRAGARRFVDLHMHMPGGWSLARAAALRSSVEQALMSAVPGLRATIQLLPMDVEAHAGDAKDLI